MKKLGKLLNEVKGEKAHREAVAMGLKYKGFGYWVDPSTGETKYKTENDQLVAVDPDVEADKAGKSLETDQGAGPDGNPMGAMSTGMQMQQPAGTLPQPGQLPLGAPEPGEEIAPKEMEWEPGPDGSTCVDSDNPPAEVPEDSYVSTKNNLKWGAGPDGTNYTNIDYAEIIQNMRNPTMDSFLDRQNKMEEIQRGRQHTFLSTFMAEAPQAGSAADEAKAQGLTYSGYGYWKDSSGRVVAQTQGDRLVMLDDQGGNTAATTDMGNPTGPASGMTPADKARSMGLTSNGSGGYVDQEGNVIARTVNNELVFYDSRAGGGAVSDGSGGAQLTQSSPSWVDPVTGLIVVPPGQPESPVEINAVPDPIPATPPAGYDAFVQQRKLQMYQQDAERREAEAIAAQQQAELEAQTGISDVLNPPGAQFESFIDEARRRAAPIKTTRIEPEQDIETPEAKAAREAKAGRNLRLQQGGFRGMGAGGTTPTQQTPPERPLQQSLRTTQQDAAGRVPPPPKPPTGAQAAAGEPEDDGKPQRNDLKGKLEQTIANPDLHAGEKIMSLREQMDAYNNSLKTSLGDYWIQKDKVDGEAARLMSKLEKIQGLEGVDDATKMKALGLTQKYVERFRNRRRDIPHNHPSEAQIQGLIKRAPELREVFAINPETGTHYPDRIKEYKAKQRINNFTPELMKVLWDSLPADARSKFGGGGDVKPFDGFVDWLQTDAIDGMTGEYLDPERLNQDHSIAGSKAQRHPELGEFILSNENLIGMDKVINQKMGKKDKIQFIDKWLQDYGDPSMRAADIQNFLYDLNDTKFDVRGNVPKMIQSLFTQREILDDDGNYVNYFNPMEPGQNSRDVLNTILETFQSNNNQILDPMEQQLRSLDTGGLLDMQGNKGAFAKDAEGNRLKDDKGEEFRISPAQAAKRGQAKLALDLINEMRGSDVDNVFETLGGEVSSRDPQEGGSLTRSYYPNKIRGADFSSKAGQDLWRHVREDLLLRMLEDGTKDGQVDMMHKWWKSLQDGNRKNKERWQSQLDSNGRLLSGAGLSPEAYETHKTEREKALYEESERNFLQHLVDGRALFDSRLSSDDQITLKDILGRPAMFSEGVNEEPLAEDDLEYVNDESYESKFWHLLSLLHGMDDKSDPFVDKPLTFEAFLHYNNQ